MARLTHRNVPWVTILVTLALLLIGVVAPRADSAAGSLFFELVLSQQWPFEAWRWLTAHLVHADLEHLLLNAVTWLLLGTLLERHSRMLLIAALLAGAAAVDVWFFPFGGLDYYCGMSGVLNAVLVVVLAQLLQLTEHGNGRWTWLNTNNVLVAVVVVGAVLKALYELSTHDSLLTHFSWPSAPGAHVAGLLAGGLLALVHIAARTGPGAPFK